MTERAGRAESSRTVGAVGTACDIVDGLRDLDGAGVTELAGHLDISKSAVHAQLATLAEHEFVYKEGDEYHLGLKFLDLGRYVNDRIDIYDVVAEETERLAEESGEVAQYMTEEHGVGVYLHKATGENGVQTASYTGSREDLHCTALGKAILAELPDDRVEAIIDRRGLAERTENTITDRETLFEELERIRSEGVAYDRGEILQGLHCVATAVTDADGEVLGALSISGPVSRLADEERTRELEEMLLHSANVIEINAARVR